MPLYNVRELSKQVKVRNKKPSFNSQNLPKNKSF